MPIFNLGVRRTWVVCFMHRPL